MIGDMEIGGFRRSARRRHPERLLRRRGPSVPRADDRSPPQSPCARVRARCPDAGWHPPGHHSFASTHKGRRPFETIEASYGPQILWPDHCVQGTRGAEIHAALDIPHAELILRKGSIPRSIPIRRSSKTTTETPTGLAGYLRERGLARVHIAGLALDFCVRYSAEDAHRNGFSLVVLEDACRAIDTGGSLAKPGTLLQLSAFAASAAHWEDRNAGRRGRGGASLA